MNEISTDCAYFFQIHSYIVDFFLSGQVYVFQF